MGKTTEVAADRAYDQTKTVLPKEVARGVYMQHAPSLQALKLMHLMIGTAGGAGSHGTVRHASTGGMYRTCECWPTRSANGAWRSRYR